LHVDLLKGWLGDDYDMEIKGRLKRGDLCKNAYGILYLKLFGYFEILCFQTAWGGNAGRMPDLDKTPVLP